MRFRLALLVAASAAMMNAASDTSRRLETAATVFNEVMSAPDRGIPNDLMDRAVCVGIIPGMKKAGFIVGGQYGRGFLVCRDSSQASGWSAPAAMKVEGGSIGAQIGGGETDVVLVVMNEGGKNKLLQSEFTVGGDAGVMAGPVGRDASAQTDALMHAQILSYSRSRGAFAGITLNGATFRDDKDGNRELYGSAVSEEKIINGHMKPPAEAQVLYSALNRGAGKGEAARTKTTPEAGKGDRKRH